MRHHRIVQLGLLGVITLACLGAAARRPDDAAAIRSALGSHVKRLDSEIAQRMMQRVGTPGNKLPQLELEIDLRLVTRWLMQQAMAASPGSDVQVAAWLRASLFMEGSAAIEESMRRTTVSTPATAEGMARLHQLTYEMRELKSVRDVDETGRKLGMICLLLAPPGSGAEKAPPMMRPRPVRPAPEPPPPPRQGGEPRKPEPRTATQMSAAIAGLNISTSLKQQLLALATRAQLTSAEPENDREKATLMQTLDLAMELAEGLGANIGVSAEGRAQIESQLAEGIALFMDTRTREQGRSRIASLQQYRQTLARIYRMQLTPDQVRQFTPLFKLLRESPEQGNKAIAALERLLDYKTRFESRKAAAHSMAAIKRACEELERQALAARTQGLAAASEGNAADVEARADELRRIWDLLEKLDSLPGTLDRLQAYRPKPAGGIERRIALAAQALTGKDAAAKNEAATLIEDVTTLGDRSAELIRTWTGDIPADIDKRYAGGKLAAMESKWKAIISELASGIAGGGSLDVKRLERLSAAIAIHQSLKQATALEAALSKAQALHGWVDWRATPDDIRLVLSPWQEGLVETVAAYISDTGGTDWAKIDRRYRPLVQMIGRLAAYKDQCEAMPGGLIGTAGGLMTPIDNSPFGIERHVSFLLAAWRELLEAGDTVSSDDILATLLRRAGGE